MRSIAAILTFIMENYDRFDLTGRTFSKLTALKTEQILEETR